MRLSYSICFFALLALSNPAYGGFMDNLQDGLKYIRDSVVYTAKDLYGAAGFAYESLKFASQELRDHTPSNKEEYDFIVVGAGAAGAPVAARLSEIQDAKVLLIEAGGHESTLFDIPILAIFGLLYPIINWNFKSEPSNDFCLGFHNNQCKYHQGKVMGGSSVINLMLACRGSKRDYDEWGDATGDPGWSYEGMLKYFKKLENNKLTVADADPKYRGTGGPVDIIHPPYRSSIADAYVKAGEELGFPPVDYNGEKLTGFSYAQTNQRNGERLSSNRAYLHPARKRKNLVVTMHSHVNKVLIDPDTKTAKGVEFTKHGRKIKVYAKKEVILSAGALNTPKILMLSGIGPAEHLRSLGINVIADLPVGENLTDHIGYGGLMFMVNGTDGVIILDFINPGNPTDSEFLADRKGPMTTSGGIEGVGYLNTNNVTSEDEKPNVELMLVSSTHLSSYLVHVTWGQPGYKFLESWGEHLYHRAFFICPMVMKPKSRGKVLLRSTKPTDKPKVYPHYFEDPDDIRVGLQAIRMALKVGETQAMKQKGVKLVDKPIWGCEGHEPNSDDYWICAMKTFTLSFWHFSGTAKMGKEDDPFTVVNPKLQVKGIKNLRVIDASIMPDVPNAHTNIPSMAIGEKGADLVKADYGYI